MTVSWASRSFSSGDKLPRPQAGGSTDESSPKSGVLFVGVLRIMALLFGVHIWAPDFGNSQISDKGHGERWSLLNLCLVLLWGAGAEGMGVLWLFCVLIVMV